MKICSFHFIHCTYRCIFIPNCHISVFHFAFLLAIEVAFKHHTSYIGIISKNIQGSMGVYGGGGESKVCIIGNPLFCHLIRVLKADFYPSGGLDPPLLKSKDLFRLDLLPSKILNMALGTHFTFILFYIIIIVIILDRVYLKCRLIFIVNC